LKVTRPMPATALTGVVDHPLLGQGLNYSAQQVREDPDGQVADTLKIMGRYVQEDANSPEIQADAQQCIGSDELETVAKVWGLTQGKIQFMRDETTAIPLSNVLGGSGDVVEVLIRPRDMAGMRGVRIGDCDDYSMYAACLLTCLGIPCTFVTMAGDDKQPGRFTHVYVAAYPMGGDGNRQRVAIDASHGEEAGWEALRLKPWARKAEWAMDGGCTAGDGGGLGGLLAAGLWVGAGWVLWQLCKGRTLLGV